MIDWREYVPEMLTGDKLKKALMYLPKYDKSICEKDATTRLMSLSNIYKLYIPQIMSCEIYSKLYLAMLMSLNKKETKQAILQQRGNFIGSRTKEFRGVIGGSDSFSIIGKSGIGKSSAIDRAITLIANDKIIEIESPYIKIVPIIQVQCPFDCSPKSLLLEILRAVDERLDSDYYKSGTRTGVTTDTLIGLVSQVCLNHIGVLIIDEIQNVLKNKKGTSLVGMMMQLINSSGISLCMVGVPESIQFFESEMQLARRSLGLQYDTLQYDEQFIEFCNLVYLFQYTKKRVYIDAVTRRWLYEHSRGVVSLVVSLIHDAQELAIMNGHEQLDIEMLAMAYEKRMVMLHSRVEIQKERKPQTTRKMKDIVKTTKANLNVNQKDKNLLINDVVLIAKSKNFDVVEMLKRYITVEEVRI